MSAEKSMINLTNENNFSDIEKKRFFERYNKYINLRFHLKNFLFEICNTH